MVTACEIALWVVAAFIAIPFTVGVHMCRAKRSK
jgi:hypothetical protein